jgi:hypothetical protein
MSDFDELDATAKAFDPSQMSVMIARSRTIRDDRRGAGT